MTGLIGLAAVAVALILAVAHYVRPEAQNTAYVMIDTGFALGVALKIRTGSVW